MSSGGKVHVYCCQIFVAGGKNCSRGDAELVINGTSSWPVRQPLQHSLFFLIQLSIWVQPGYKNKYAFSQRYTVRFKFIMYWKHYCCVKGIKDHVDRSQRCFVVFTALCFMGYHLICYYVVNVTLTLESCFMSMLYTLNYLLVAQSRSWRWVVPR